MSEESISLIKHQLEQEKIRNQEYKAKLQSFNEIISEVKASNYRFEKECSELRHANALLIDDQATSKREIRDLQTIISRLENKPVEGISSDGNMKLLLNQKDELLRKYNEILSQHENLKLQYSQTLTRHKEEIQQSRNIEIQMNEEAERLTREVKSLHTQWLQADAERKRLESLHKSESSESSITISKLKFEVEKLQRDISSLAEDKETLTRDNDNHIATNKNLQSKIQLLEHSLKAAAIQDQSKAHHELLQYESKISSLQQERQNMQYDLDTERRRYTDLEIELGKQKDKYKYLSREFYQKDEIIDRLQSSISTLEANLKKSMTNEADLKAELLLVKNKCAEHVSEIEKIKLNSGSSNSSFVDISGSDLQQKIELIKSLEIKYDELLFQYNQALQKVEGYRQNEAAMIQQIKMLAQRNETLSSDLISHRHEYERMQEEVEKYSSQTSLALNNLKLTEDRNKELESRIDSLVKQKSSLESDQLNLRHLLGQLEKEKESILSKAKQLESESVSLKKHLEDRSTQLDELKASSNHEINSLNESLSSRQESIQQLNQQIAFLRSEQERSQHEHELSYSTLQSSTNKTISELMDEVQTLDRLVQSERSKYSRDSTALQEQTVELEKSLRLYEQKCEELEELLRTEKSSSALKELQWERVREKLTSDLQHRDMGIKDVIAERDAFMGKVKTLKESCRAAESKLRLLEATSTSSSSSLMNLPTNLDPTMTIPDTIDQSTEKRSVKIKQSPEKRSAELVTIDEEKDDVDSIIMKTQRLIEKRSKIGSANSSSKDASAYQHAADTALALVSSAYDKQQSSSPPKPQHKENIHVPNTQNLESSEKNLSADKKQNTFRDRLSRSIRAAGNALK